MITFHCQESHSSKTKLVYCHLPRVVVTSFVTTVQHYSLHAIQEGKITHLSVDRQLFSIKVYSLRKSNVQQISLGWSKFHTFVTYLYDTKNKPGKAICNNAYATRSCLQDSRGNCTCFMLPIWSSGHRCLPSIRRLKNQCKGHGEAFCASCSRSPTQEVTCSFLAFMCKDLCFFLVFNVQRFIPLSSALDDQVLLSTSLSFICSIFAYTIPDFLSNS